MNTNHQSFYTCFCHVSTGNPSHSNSQNTAAQAEAAMFESYTESLNRLNDSVSALNDYLVSQSKLFPDSCSTVATSSNAVPVAAASDSATAGESENLDMPQQPD